MKRKHLKKTSDGITVAQQKTMRNYEAIGYKLDEFRNGILILSRRNADTGGMIFQFIDHNGVCVRTASETTWKSNV